VLISLIGLPGVGKSTVGRRLARRLDVPFVDCDVLLEERLKRRIRDVFELEGEAHFRDLEADLLQELVAAPDGVLATGGGVVLRPGNRRLLREKTHCVYLSSRPEALFRRLRRDTRRPLLQVEDPEARLRELSAEREPLYREAASQVLETPGRTTDELVEAIVQSLPMPASGGPGAQARA
jgi:shikimate kinase